MTTVATIFKGVVHGKTIDLDRAPEMPEGQAVSVVLRPTLPSGEGLRQAFGSWADDAEKMEQFLHDVRQRRKDGRAEPQL